MLTTFESVVLDVTDFASALRDYALLLGRAPAYEGFDPDQGTRIAGFALANASLELRAIPPHPRGGGGSPIGWRDSDGIAGIRLSGILDVGGGLRPGRGADAGAGVPIELLDASDGGAAGAAAPSADPAAGIEGLDHVVIASPDPERTRRRLADDLGLRLALDRRFPERGLRLIFFRIGGVTLEIASPLAAPSPAPGGEAFHGLAWKVRGLDAWHRRLEAAGFALSPLREGHKPGTRVASLRGALHGVPTLLIEHPPRPAAAPPGTIQVAGA